MYIASLVTLIEKVIYLEKNQKVLGPWDLDIFLNSWKLQKSRFLLKTEFYYMPENLMEDPLIEEISNFLKIPKEYIFVVAGISQAIHTLLNFKKWERIFITTPEFGLYSLVTKGTGKESITIKLKEFNDLIEYFKSKKSGNYDFLCFSSPRWFDGTRISKGQITELLNFYNGFIFIDEAYIDYSNEEDWSLEMCLDNDRIILARSFSKGWYLPGLRVGYIVSKYLPKTFRKSNIMPHSVSSYSIEFVKQLLKDNELTEYFFKMRKKIIKIREYAYHQLLKIDGVIPSNSAANFSCVHFEKEKFNIDKLLAINIEGVKVLKIPEVSFKYAIWEKDDIDKMINYIKECRL